MVVGELLIIVVATTNEETCCSFNIVHRDLDSSLCRQSRNVSKVSKVSKVVAFSSSL